MLLLGYFSENTRRLLGYYSDTDTLMLLYKCDAIKVNIAVEIRISYRMSRQQLAIDLVPPLQVQRSVSVQLQQPRMGRWYRALHTSGVEKQPGTWHWQGRR